MAHRTNAAAAINAGFFEIAGSDDGRPSLTLMIDGKLFSLRQQLQSLLIIDQGNIQITKASAKILVEIDDKSVIPNKDGKLINLSNAASIVTGIPLLIQNGKNVVDNPKQDDPAHARTALGVRNDGTIVVVEHIYKQHVKDLKLVQVRSILRKEKEINIPEALKILEKHLVNDTVIS
ncbi:MULTISPECIES: phosphodiester glycosidase family protein, partial [spotted fever group]